MIREARGNRISQNDHRLASAGGSAGSSQGASKQALMANWRTHPLSATTPTGSSSGLDGGPSPHARIKLRTSSSVFSRCELDRLVRGG